MLPEACPACGGELLQVNEKDVRFQPTYVSRVSRTLHGAPPLHTR